MLSLGIFFPTVWVAVPLSLIRPRQAGRLRFLHPCPQQVPRELSSTLVAPEVVFQGWKRMRFFRVDPGPASQTSF